MAADTCTHEHCSGTQAEAGASLLSSCCPFNRFRAKGITLDLQPGKKPAQLGAELQGKTIPEIRAELPCSPLAVLLSSCNGKNGQPRWRRVLKHGPCSSEGLTPSPWWASTHSRVSNQAYEDFWEWQRCATGPVGDLARPAAMAQPQPAGTPHRPLCSALGAAQHGFEAKES